MAGDHVTKADIANSFIHAWKLKSYLEYNKYDGENLYADVNCPEKEIAFIPEVSFLDAGTAERLLYQARIFATRQIFSVEELLQAYSGKKFDIIFFDPVHIRPDVDYALRALPSLLKDGGVLLVHDCNPPRKEWTDRVRKFGPWVGETFKAFALFRRYNPSAAMVVDEDFGVGIIVNRNLTLDYPCSEDIEFETVSADKRSYLGLCSYDEFTAHLNEGRLPELLTSLPHPEDNSGWHPVTGQRDDDLTVDRRVELGKCRCVVTSPAGCAAHERDLRYDSMAQRLRIPLPSTAQAVEIQFSCGPACFIIQQMDVLDGSGFVHWKWRGDLSRWHSPANVRYVTVGLHQILFCVGTEPGSISFNLDGSTAGFPPDAQLEIGIVPLTPVTGQLIGGVYDAFEAPHITSAQKRISALEWLAADLARQLDEANALVRQWDRRLQLADGLVTERDLQLREAAALIEERDRRIALADEFVRARDHEIAILRQQLAEISERVDIQPASTAR